jgi:YebC/PmpR family DNA-binding regulatory protein
MSGHSKWSTIKRQKESTDAKRGAVFTKIGNQIAIAARSGTDPAINSTLALVIDRAKAANMPLANIQRAIDRVADKNAAQLEEVMYEGYGPGGTGIIVEAATDNKNRTYPEIRTAMTKNGATMADPGSVAFQFTRKGVIRVGASGEDALLTVLDAGAEDAVEEDGEIVVYTMATDLARVREAIKNAELEVKDAELQYVPNNTITITDKEIARKVMKVMDALEDLDDVTNVHSNFDISEEALS